MLVWETIIAERHDTMWIAWFQSEPDSRFEGLVPSQAIDQLLEANAQDRFDTDKIYVLEDQSRDNHLEFRIEYLGERTTPAPRI